MIAGEVACPRCGSDAVRKDGLDRRGVQVYRCHGCRRRFTALSATPFSGYRFPPDIIALAVRWYLRYRLSSYIGSGSGVAVRATAEQRRGPRGVESPPPPRGG